LNSDGEAFMSETAPSLKPLVDSYYGACWVCSSFCMTILLFWKYHFVANLLMQLDARNGLPSLSSPVPIWLLLVFAIVPAILLPAPRVLGIVPPATALLGLAVLGPIVFGESFLWTQLVVSAIGTILAASFRYLVFYGRSSAKIPRKMMRMRKVDLALIAGCFASLLGLFAMCRGDIERLKSIEFRWFLFPIVFIFVAFAWIRLFRPFFELCVEAKVRMNYRLVVDGPGATKLPIQGPLIVIANHACWWDPLFLAKALPRPVTPMMTSIFYDRWYIKPLVKYVFGTIRVPDSRARREAPEIHVAVRSLDDGKCLILFPEGFLRRKDDVPLRRFGRGIWEILKARPETPVVCCWIEGAWGSYSSHWNGPPGKNKPKEGRRTIRIGMSEPMTVPRAILEHHLTTRIQLMNEVSKARAHLGLEPLLPFELPAKDDEPEQPA
jgi:1-acyl-sn-glycerol-3-phosphate acyltransferase